MKNILPLLFFFALVIVIDVNAQSREDVVYLHNGSILRGKMIENISGVSTTMEIVGHNTIVIPDSAVKMILMDQVVPVKNRENSASPVEMAANVNFYGGSRDSGGFTFITSYRFPSRLSIGVGLGIEWFDHQQIPFMIDTKYYILKGPFSPYLYAQGGYAVPLSNKIDGDYSEYHGGLLAGAGAGMRFNFSKRNALVFSIGYRYQKTKTVSGGYPWYSSYQPTETIRYDEFNRMTFSFGFLFN